MQLFDVYPVNDITITSGKGSYIWDDAGVEYLDLYGGHAVISIGHSHPYYVKRLTSQLNQIGLYSNSIKIPIQLELRRSWVSYRARKTISCFCAIQAQRLMRTR